MPAPPETGVWDLATRYLASIVAAVETSAPGMPVSCDDDGPGVAYVSLESPPIDDVCGSVVVWLETLTRHDGTLQPVRDPRTAAMSTQAAIELGARIRRCGPTDRSGDPIVDPVSVERADAVRALHIDAWSLAVAARAFHEWLAAEFEGRALLLPNNVTPSGAGGCWGVETSVAVAIPYPVC